MALCHTFMAFLNGLTFLLPLHVAFHDLFVLLTNSCPTYSGVHKMDHPKVRFRGMKHWIFMAWFSQLSISGLLYLNHYYFLKPQSLLKVDENASLPLKLKNFYRRSPVRTLCQLQVKELNQLKVTLCKWEATEEWNSLKKLGWSWPGAQILWIRQTLFVG